MSDPGHAKLNPDGFARKDLEMRVIFTKNIGMLLLGIWLILFGLVGYVPLIASLGILLNFLASRRAS